MCGRYTLRTSPVTVATLFDVSVPSWNPRYNIAPTQQAPVIRANASGGFELATPRWGLVPSWSKDRKRAASMINARGETVASKPSFRSAFRNRRCLALADGYYEWRLSQSGKQPFHATPVDSEFWCFAAIWESWRDPDTDEGIETFSIITTTATDVLSDLHERMPVILNDDNYKTWLLNDDVDSLENLLAPYDGKVDVNEANTYVNNARNEGPECLEV